MKAAYLTKNGFEIREVSKPQIKDDEILVKTHACGICAGDIFRYKQLKNKIGIDSWEDQVIGHEGSGVVEEAGSRVKGLKKGDPVTSLGGTYSEYYVSRPELNVKLPGGIDPRWALGEPVACCVHAAMRFGIKLGDRVAVIGSGFMGLVCAQLARILGAGYITAFDIVDWRLERAR